MSVTTLIPLRSPGVGKTRLAGDLDRGERAGLAGAMLADVVTAVRGADLGRVVVVASGAGAVAAGAALNLPVVVDRADAGGLNGALEHARCVCAVGCDVLVVQADLPALTADDVTALADTAEAVALAPNDDGGTSALLRRPGDVMPTGFGPGSARRHVELAELHHVALRVVERPGLQYDVDTVADLRDLAARGVGSATSRFIRQHPWLLDD